MKLLPLPKPLSFELIEENGWNAVALPIPDDAAADLLEEIISMAGSYHDIHNDEAKEFVCADLDVPIEVSWNAELACVR